MFTSEANYAAKTLLSLIKYRCKYFCLFLSFAFVAQVAHDVQFEKHLHGKSVYIPIGCQCFAAEIRHSTLHEVEPLFGCSGRLTFVAGSVCRLCHSCA